MKPNTRAQSETVGVVLLTGVILLVTVGTGAVIISNVASQGDDVPSVNIEGQATTQYVTIDHTGGNRLATSDVVVILDGEQRERYSLGDFTQQTGDDDTRFEPGDTWRHTNEVGGDNIRILVVHEPSNTILDEETVAVEVTIVARFSYSPANPTPVDTVTFDAGDSEADEESELDSYEWDFDGDGTTDRTGETVDYSFPDDGEYPVTLTVTADDGRTANRTKSVRVYNVFPDAEFTYSPSNPDPGEQIDFDASSSNDPDGSIVSYEWDFDDDGTVDATGETTSNSYDSEGNYTVRLNVTDDDGATRRRAENVSVGGVGNPSGEVDVQDEIKVNADEFEVTTSNFENLDPDDGGYLVVENEDSGDTKTFENVGEDIKTINEANDGFEIKNKQTITATLYEGLNKVNQLDTDSTTVSSGGGDPGNGGDGSADQVLTYNSANKLDGGVVYFDVENTADQSVTVERFAIDATGIQNNAKLDNSDSDEVRVVPDSGTDGFANDGKYNAKGKKFDFNAASTINSGSGAEIDMRILEESNGETLSFDLEQVDNEADADVTVTLELSDGSDQKFYFEDVS